jgi:hypothetical protein
MFAWPIKRFAIASSCAAALLMSAAFAVHLLDGHRLAAQCRSVDCRRCAVTNLDFRGAKLQVGGVDLGRHDDLRDTALHCVQLSAQRGVLRTQHGDLRIVACTALLGELQFERHGFVLQRRVVASQHVELVQSARQRGILIDVWRRSGGSDGHRSVR